MEKVERDKVVQEYYKLMGSEDRFYDVIVELMGKINEKVQADEYNLEMATGIISCAIAQLVQTIAKMFAAIRGAGWIDDETLNDLQMAVQKQLQHDIAVFRNKLEVRHGDQ